MIKRILSILMVLSVMLTICAYAEDEELIAKKTILQAGFENLTEWNGTGTDSTKSFLYNNTGGIGTLTAFNWSELTSLKAAPAPEPENKPEGTVLSGSEENFVDKALEIHYLGNQVNTYFYNTFAAISGVITISTNVYVESSTYNSHALLACEVRGIGTTQLFSLRNPKTSASNNNTTALQFNGSSAISSGYGLKTWVNIKFVIDTVNNTYTPYMNNVQMGSGNLTITSDINQIRFSVIRSDYTTNDKLYVDDIIVTTGKDITPIFAKTKHASGIDNTQTTNISKDMTDIVVKFPAALNEDILSSHIELLKSTNRGDVSVPCTVSYNLANYEYTFTLPEAATPNAEYIISFKEGLQTTDGLISDNAFYIRLTTEAAPFAVTDIYFTENENTDELITSISKIPPVICANADLVYDNTMPEPQNVTLMVGVYKEIDGRLYLADLKFKKTQINIPSFNGMANYRFSMPVTNLGVLLDSSYKLGVFVWDDILNANALSGISFTDVLTN